MKRLSNVGFLVALLVPTLGLSLLVGVWLATRAIYRKFKPKDYIDAEFRVVNEKPLLGV